MHRIVNGDGQVVATCGAGGGDGVGGGRAYAAASWTQAEAAVLLGVSSRTVRRMLDRGELKGVRVSGRTRVPSEAIERVLGGGGETKSTQRRGGSGGTQRGSGVGKRKAEVTR